MPSWADCSLAATIARRVCSRQKPWAARSRARTWPSFTISHRSASMYFRANRFAPRHAGHPRPSRSRLRSQYPAGSLRSGRGFRVIADPARRSRPEPPEELDRLRPAGLVRLVLGPLVGVDGDGSGPIDRGLDGRRIDPRSASLVLQSTDLLAEGLRFKLQVGDDVAIEDRKSVV